MSQVQEQERSEREIVESGENFNAPDVLDASQSPDLEPDIPEEGAVKKVQLDIDDAPFLADDEEEKKKEEEESEEAEDDDKSEAKPKKSKKKLIIIGVAVLLLLIILAAAAYFLLFSGGEEPPVDVPQELVEPEPTTVIVTVDESYTQPVITPVYNTTLEPFWVEMRDASRTFFLVCTFTISTENQDLSDEIQTKIPQIRDIIYYYLNTKDYVFLTSYDNFTVIKADLLEAVNEELIDGELEDILYDNYLVR